MLEKIKGAKAQHLSGEQIQTIGRSLFYKRLDLILGGKGEGEPTAYDALRGKLRAEVPEEIWATEGNYTVVLNRRERRLTKRALKFAARNPASITEHLMMQADTPKLGDNNSGLGIAESQLDTAKLEARDQATQFALAAMATRHALVGRTSAMHLPPISKSVTVQS